MQLPAWLSGSAWWFLETALWGSALLGNRGAAGVSGVAWWLLVCREGRLQSRGGWWGHALVSFSPHEQSVGCSCLTGWRVEEMAPNAVQELPIYTQLQPQKSSVNWLAVLRCSWQPTGTGLAQPGERRVNISVFTKSYLQPHIFTAILYALSGCVPSLRNI